MSSKLEALAALSRGSLLAFGYLSMSWLVEVVRGFSVKKLDRPKLV